MAESKMIAGDVIRHPMTGVEGKVLRVFKGKALLLVEGIDGKIFSDWFAKRGFVVASSAALSSEQEK